MEIGLTKLSSGFTLENFPYLPCTLCGIDYLIPTTQSFVRINSIKSAEIINDPEADSTWDFGHFNGVIACRNSECLARHVISGSYRIEENCPPNEGEDEYLILYAAKYLRPAFNLLSRVIPINTPEEVKQAILEAEKVLLTDPNAAGNRLRLAIEEVLTHYGINRFKIEKRKRVRLTTHQRLVDFKHYEGSVADIFMAVKWIGNQGSHEDSLTVADIAQATEILNFGLEILYGDGDREIEKKINKILKGKGIRKKK